MLAGLLGQPGYTVAAVGRRRPAMPGEPHQHILVDLADPAATENAARQLAAVTFGAAVFTAGIDSRQGVTRLEPAVFSRVMQVNCFPTFSSCGTWPLPQIPGNGRFGSRRYPVT